MELLAVAGHENVQVGLQSMQVVKGSLVNLWKNRAIEDRGINCLRTNRHNSIDSWDVHVRSFLADAENRKLGEKIQGCELGLTWMVRWDFQWQRTPLLQLEHDASSKLAQVGSLLAWLCWFGRRSLLYGELCSTEFGILTEMCEAPVAAVPSVFGLLQHSSLL